MKQGLLEEIMQYLARFHALNVLGYEEYAIKNSDPLETSKQHYCATGVIACCCFTTTGCTRLIKMSEQKRPLPGAGNGQLAASICRHEGISTEHAPQAHPVAQIGPHTCTNAGLGLSQTCGRYPEEIDKKLPCVHPYIHYVIVVAA